MKYLIVSFVGAIWGSIPSAWLLLKFMYGKDIRSEGSGNVGALNSYEVTNSVKIGVIVLIIDLLKGAISVFLCRLIYPNEFVPPALALIMAVFCHCFNPWLRFKGGRGLATAAGGTLLLCPILLLIWIILFGITFLIKRNVHLGNFAATICTVIIIFIFSDLFTKFAFPVPQNPELLVIFSLNLLMIILIKHFDPIVELYDSYKTKNR
jgi:acyl phosphate:glycerol-3-phosphate acyltransferase